MRLFVALDIDEDIRNRIARFVDDVRGYAPAARWVRPESLHVTLKFIGEKTEEEAKQIERALETIRSDSFQINIRGFGFFPSARVSSVFWIGIEENAQLVLLAAVIEDHLAKLGIAKEHHAFNPHLTIARDRPRGGAESQKNRKKMRGFGDLHNKLSSFSTPEFGTMKAGKFFLYQSQTSPGGSKYTKLATFELH